LELLKGDIAFGDFFGKTLEAKERLCCGWLINKGKLIKEKPAEKK